jgi:putative tryptophan/tyrosine transport system substrate-binding protein
MRRRDLLIGSLLASAGGPAWAQQTGKVYRIAILDPGTPAEVMNESANPEFPLWGPLFTELRRLGYAERQNLTVERYARRSDYTPDLARKVVSRNPDLIFAVNNYVAQDVLAATDTIPVVGLIAVSLWPDLVAKLAHPGGNFTGVSIDAAVGVYGKHLELLREMLPNMSRLGIVTLKLYWERAKTPVEKFANDLGIAVVGPFLERPVTDTEIRRVLAAMSEERVQALDVIHVSEVFSHTPLIVQLAKEYRLPSVYFYRYFAQIGGLMAYDYGLSDLGGIIADQIDQILKGTKPGDIPIYQAQNYKLSINLNTAKALGITVPQSLLARADEVFE